MNCSMAGARLGAAAIAAAGALSSAALAFDQEKVVSDVRLAEFETVYIAPVAVALDQRRDDRSVTDKDASERAARFHEEMTEKFSKKFEIAAAPGPQVLAIEATLTDLTATRPTQGDFAKEPGLSFQSVYAGGAAFAASFSVDGVVVAEVSDRYVSTLADSAPRIGVWQDADRAFSQWSRALVRFVEEN